jgi:oxygen-dependent protoporphyrinogen oxidase
MGTASAVPRIVVVGGGVTGLAAAHRLQEIARERRSPVEIVLVEGSARLGGCIGSERREGFLLERGPDSFVTEKPHALELCRRLGITDQLIGVEPEGRRGYVVKDGRLLPVPDRFHLLAPVQLGPFLASPLFSWPGKLRMALDLVLPPRRDDEDESLASFVTRRLGQEALTRMAQPMIAGIYGGDAQRLSVLAILPRLRELERTHGSLIRGLRAAAGRSRALVAASGARYGMLATFRGGMQTLVDALAARLPPECLRLATPVHALTPGADRWRIRLGGRFPEHDGEILEADAVCLALPAAPAARLITPFDPALGARLGSIPYRSTATVNLAYRREAVPHPLNGAGFVVPSVERRLLVGCTFSSTKFTGRAPDGSVLLRAYLGEAVECECDDEEIAAAVRRELRELLGIEAFPLFASVYRNRRARPQYTVGHRERVAAMERLADCHPGLVLAGSAYRGLGVPDCVRDGEDAAELLMAAAGPAGNDRIRRITV